MVFDEADEIRGSMSESIGAAYAVELPQRYRATIRRSSFRNYATDQEVTTYHLLKLEHV